MDNETVLFGCAPQNGLITLGTSLGKLSQTTLRLFHGLSKSNKTGQKQFYCISFIFYNFLIALHCTALYSPVQYCGPVDHPLASRLLIQVLLFFTLGLCKASTSLLQLSSFSSIAVCRTEGTPSLQLEFDNIKIKKRCGW